MNLTKLTTAIAEADRFIRRAEALRDEHLQANNDRRAIKPTEHIWSGKSTGAVRRSSMDLTRALADLRKPN